MFNHQNSNQMHYGTGSNSYNNFGQYHPYNQQLLEASANTYGSQHLSSSSPSMMNPMLHHNMSSHQMQQMQQ